MKITIVGGGTSSIILSVLAKLKYHEVSILTRKPDKWERQLFIHNEDQTWNSDRILTAYIDNITSDYDILRDTDIILICGVPVQFYKDIFESIRDYLPTKHFYIGSICAYGGFNWLVDKYLSGKQYTIFGFQLIPFMCNTTKYGKKCKMFGAKRLLRFATDGEHSLRIQNIMQDIIGIKLRPTNFLTCTLWQNNPSLHPPILYALFQNWDGTSYYEPSTLPVYIYGDLTQNVSDVIEKLDNEIRLIQDCIKTHNPHVSYYEEFKSIHDCIAENYKDQIDDNTTLFSCITTNSAFKSHKMQYIQNEHDLIKPNINHKFFEDCPFGLCIYKDIALHHNIETPLIDKLILWNQSLIGKEYLVDGKLTGKDMSETACPTILGRNIDTI